MTAPEHCMICNGEHPNNWMLTCINPALTIYACREDIAENLILLLAEVTGVDGAKLMEVVSAFLNDAADAHAAQVEQQAEQLDAAGAFADSVKDTESEVQDDDVPGEG